MTGKTTLPGNVDIAIIGGGMVGLSLASILANGGGRFTVAVIEAMPLADMASDATPLKDLPPSFDARSSALSESSRLIYEQVGIWRDLAGFACPIEAIHVSDRGNPGVTRMTAKENGLPGLGYVIENRILGKLLAAAVAGRDGLSIHSPVNVDRLVPVPGGMEVHAGEAVCRAGLVIAAGGADFHALQSLGITAEEREYGQSALIANIALSRSHRGVAYERFTDEGPVALLPLPDAGREHRGALVWTLRPERAGELAVAPEAEFLAALHRRFGYRAGRFLRCGARATYPLKRVLAREQVRSHLAVVGNAAHFLHPVAGQGFNLALRDVARLAEVVAAGVDAGRNPGELALLETYLARQHADQRNTVGFSHGLPGLFGDASPAAGILRTGGLIALDLLTPLRQEFSRFGAGLLNPGVKLGSRAG